MHLQVQNLQKRYGLATVLDLPELDIDSGASFGLVGNNGAGKTTFLRLVLDHPPKRGPGTAQWAGRGPRRRLEGLHGILPRPCLPHRLPDARGIHPLRRQSIWHEPGPDRGKMGTLPSLFRRSTARRGEYIRNLSEGNKKKVGLVAALMVEPRLLVLDEPFANLDPTSQIRLKDMLKAADQTTDTTLIISSHDLSHITEVCRRIAVIERGVIVRDIRTAPDTLRELERYFAVEET